MVIIEILAAILSVICQNNVRGISPGKKSDIQLLENEIALREQKATDARLESTAWGIDARPEMSRCAIPAFQILTEASMMRERNVPGLGSPDPREFNRIGRQNLAALEPSDDREYIAHGVEDDPSRSVSMAFKEPPNPLISVESACFGAIDQNQSVIEINPLPRFHAWTHSGIKVGELLRVQTKSHSQQHSARISTLQWQIFLHSDLLEIFNALHTY